MLKKYRKESFIVLSIAAVIILSAAAMAFQVRRLGWFRVVGLEVVGWSGYWCVD